MAVEIERKFLVKNDQWRDGIQSKINIRQAYLQSDLHRSVRVRIKGDRALLTIKGKVDKGRRSEFEYEIPLKDAQEMMALCEKPAIEKQRYQLEFKGKIWEIDVFERDNAGLVLAECELDQYDENIELPSWIGQEVTEDARYYNAYLIDHSYSSWSS